MKKRILPYIFFLLLPASLLAETFPSVRSVAQRRVPWLAAKLEFSLLQPGNKKDVFEIFSRNNRICIAASNANAAAAGLNYYLEEYCHRSMSHLGDNLFPVINIPLLKDTVRISTPFAYRYALNYCTINYTMSFYTWKDWERELDWMALHGFNLVLIPVGLEKIWQNSLQQIGFSQKEIKDFIPGPAFTAWWLMGNQEGWGGPVSQTMIDQQAALAKKIIARMKELGIQPVMQGFYGMVPTLLKKKFPAAKIIEQGKWVGGFTRPDFLLPQDGLFAKLSGIYYTEIKKLYGSDINFFGGEPFHEGGKAEGINVPEATRLVQQTMQQYFPNSTWVLQGWGKNPSTAFLEKLDKEHTLVIELFGENTRNWEQRKGYENTNFIWSNVSNFGEKNGLYGRLQRFASEVYYAKNSSFGNLLKGVGIIPEGINNNPVAYDLMSGLAWEKDSVDTKQWIKKYVRYRYGIENEDLQNAWQLLLQTVYSSPGVYQEGPSESIFCARPGLNLQTVSSWGTRKRNYDTSSFAEAVKLFIKAGRGMKLPETYTTDKIDLTRQLNANRADVLYKQMGDAVAAKDKNSFIRSYDQFEKLLLQQDSLLSSSQYFSLSKWLLQSQNFGQNKADKQLALRNAKTQITYWGSNEPKTDLRDYAHKEWSGLLSSLYVKRWRLFKDVMLSQMNDEKKTADYFSMEKKWADSPVIYTPLKISAATRDNLIERIIR
ncbi:MAG TPA: alpha-N-acetylglucosaminidase [Chitinophagaceae bacterium]